MTPKLTNRQRECLKWAALGKSMWVTGAIIGVTEHAVNHHLRGARRALGVSTTIHAVALAVKLGLVDVDIPGVGQAA